MICQTNSQPRGARSLSKLLTVDDLAARKAPLFASDIRESISQSTLFPSLFSPFGITAALEGMARSHLLAGVWLSEMTFFQKANSGHRPLYPDLLVSSDLAETSFHPQSHAASLGLECAPGTGGPGWGRGVCGGDRVPHVATAERASEFIFAAF